jgi:hypothetical protein
MQNVFSRSSLMYGTISLSIGSHKSAFLTPISKDEEVEISAARPPGAELPFERVIEAIAQTNGDRNGSSKRISRRRVCRDNY